MAIRPVGAIFWVFVLLNSLVTSSSLDSSISPIYSISPLTTNPLSSGSTDHDLSTGSSLRKRCRNSINALDRLHLNIPNEELLESVATKKPTVYTYQEVLAALNSCPVPEEYVLKAIQAGIRLMPSVESLAALGKASLSNSRVVEVFLKVQPAFFNREFNRKYFSAFSMHTIYLSLASDQSQNFQLRQKVPGYEPYVLPCSSEEYWKLVSIGNFVKAREMIANGFMYLDEPENYQRVADFLADPFSSFQIFEFLIRQHPNMFVQKYCGIEAGCNLLKNSIEPFRGKIMARFLSYRHVRDMIFDRALHLKVYDDVNTIRRCLSNQQAILQSDIEQSETYFDETATRIKQALASEMEVFVVDTHIFPRSLKFLDEKRQSPLCGAIARKDLVSVRAILGRIDASDLAIFGAKDLHPMALAIYYDSGPDFPMISAIFGANSASILEPCALSTAYVFKRLEAFDRIFQLGRQKHFLSLHSTIEEIKELAVEENRDDFLHFHEYKDYSGASEMLIDNYDSDFLDAEESSHLRSILCDSDDDEPETEDVEKEEEDFASLSFAFSSFYEEDE